MLALNTVERTDRNTTKRFTILKMGQCRGLEEESERRGGML